MWHVKGIELWIDRGEFQKTVSIVRNQRMPSGSSPFAGSSSISTSGSPSRALAIASRARKVLMDHLKLTYTDAGKTGGLLDWYELSIQKPEEVLERTKRRRQETGKNRASDMEEFMDAVLYAAHVARTAPVSTSPA